MMKLFRGGGSAKLVTEYSYPLTGLACVSRVHTEYGVFLISAQGLFLRETYGPAGEMGERLPVSVTRPEGLSPE